MSCTLRPFLLFKSLATSPLHTCSLPPSPSTSREHTQATAQSFRNQVLWLFLLPLPSLHLLNMASKSDNAENGSAPATPKAAAAGGGYSSLTTREQEILAKAMTCLKTAPEVSICTRTRPSSVKIIPHPCLGFSSPVQLSRLQW